MLGPTAIPKTIAIKPTLLNGEPVEVDTTIDVIFSKWGPHKKLSSIIFSLP
jgi:hypothetical protein